MTAPAAQLRRPDPGEEIFTAGPCHILETWNRADDPGLSVARARVQPGVTTRWHRHQGIAERYLIVAGRGLAQVEGMAPAPLQPGDLLYIPAGCAQRIRNTGTADLAFDALCAPRFRATAYQDLDGPNGASRGNEET